ncbi:hypothetical protein CPB86DRAFT_786079 [Serendipita vermifera]|nr:hypothetical protein CPB86DRAFT_786079 [Serendipita vermifera]
MSGLQGDIYTLYCVLEDNPRASFSVKLPPSASVADLKKAIVKENPNDLTGIDAKNLILYHVQLLDSPDLADHVQEVMLEELAPLLSTTELCEIYESAPPKKTIHFIVQVPLPLTSSGVVRPRSEESDDPGPLPKKKKRSKSLDPADGSRIRKWASQDLDFNDSPDNKKQKVKLRLSDPTDVRRKEPTLSTINDLLVAQRQETVKALYARLKHYQFVLVRGTPASGKSILTVLLRKYIKATEGIDAIFFGAWPKDQMPYGPKLRERGYKEGEANIIIIDDAQLSYWDTEFWNDFLKQIGPNSLSRDYVILFASYGSASGVVSVEGTPMIVPDSQRVGLRPVDHGDEVAQVGLLLTKEEFMDVVGKSFPSHRFSKDFLDYIFDTTAGHVGAVGDILRIVYSDSSYRELKIHDEEYSLETFWSKFPLERLWQGLEKTSVFRRGLPSRDDLQKSPIARVFRAVLRDNAVMEEAFESQEDQAALLLCWKNGWLHATTHQGTSVYIFTTPLHQWYVEYFLGIDASKTATIEDQDLLTFAINVVQGFSRGQLSSRKINIGASNMQRPPEAQFQDEFYRCCHTYSKGSLITFSEFGSKNGRIDFYIPFKEWGVELLRDGDRLENHSSRFTGQGKYADMKFKDYILLDFRKTVPKKEHPNIPKLYHVVFDDNYGEVRILDGSSLKGVKTFTLLNA